MDQYFRHNTENKVYKVSQQKDKILIYWVAIYGLPGGGFFHGRGADSLDDIKKALDLMHYLAKPSTEDDYITMLKNYFAADKKVREQFIAKYKL
jgi:hypothetical protein